MEIFPEFCFPKKILGRIDEWVKEKSIWVIGGCERMDYENEDFSIHCDRFENIALFFTSNRIFYHKKLLKSPIEPPLHSGNQINIFHSKYGSFSFLICSDFLDDEISSLLKRKIDFLIIPSYNRDIKTFDSNAISSCIKNTYFVIIENNNLYGNSGIYAPVHGENKYVFESTSKKSSIELNFTDFSNHRQGKKNNPKYKPILWD
jgi:hypothetical protein